MKNSKRFIALVLAIIFTFSLAGCSSSKVSDETAIGQSINSAGKYLVKKNTKPGYGDEIMLIALLRSNYIDYWHNRATLYESAMNNMISRNSYVLGEKGEVYSDGYPKVILAFTALGKYADRTSAADLIMGISFDSVVLEGGYINKINALTALESGKYEMYEEGDLERQDLIDFTLSLQQQDGSFTYKGMTDTPIKVTASAVTALALTGEESVKDAVQAGANYLITHIREDDSLDDITSTVIALNTAGITATDVEGKDMTEWLMKYQRDDGSFSFDTRAKKGNLEDTSIALLGLASQHRFDNGMTSIYDMSDVLGGTHNKLSPGWELYANVMKVFALLRGLFLAVLFIISRIRIRKWKAAGVYNEKMGRMMTDAEMAERDRLLAQQASEQENEVTETSDRGKENTVSEDAETENSDKQ